MEPRARVICDKCSMGQHPRCTGRADLGGAIRQCDCSCRGQRTVMRNRFLILTVAGAGCISAMSIKTRLDALDKSTDLAVKVKDEQECRQIIKPSRCGLADTCLATSLFAASLCKTANENAATRQPMDVQLLSDKVCRSDLELAETACRQMKESIDHAADMGSNQASRDSGLPRLDGGSSDAGPGRETRD